MDAVLRRCDEELPTFSILPSPATFIFGAAKVGQRSHANRVLDELQACRSASQRILDPDAGSTPGSSLRMHRSPSLAALKFSLLPAIISDAQATMTPAALASSFAENSTRATRVLIVDDEPCISDLLSEMLTLLGYEPTKCCSPGAALSLLANEDFDVILSDFRMPEMNGDEFFRRAVARNVALRSRFVFLTGDTVTEGTHHFLTEHGNRHLCKPFDIASVNQIIADVSSEHRSHAAQ
jgi:CheY-like chemotaxis protein